jgi:hypothetical protein
MIYPATYDITILQNATWKASMRATQDRQPLSGITVSGGVASFNAECHGLVADDAVVITAAAEAIVPCGLSLNSIYYVLASGLTNNQFYASATISGSPVSIDGAGSGIFYAAKPVNLSGYTIDADVTGILDNVQVATFACSITNAPLGAFEMSMTPAVSSGIETGRYNYDVSLTSSSGERYYWLTGVATVQRTYSRN